MSAAANGVLSLPRPLAMVFTGGAARAAAQVGMLGALLDTGIEPDLVVGSSTGAINAAVYAAHPITAVERLEAVWSSIAADSSLTSNWRKAVRGLTTSQSGRTAAMFASHLAAPLGTKTFADLGAELTLIATGLDDGLAVSINRGLVVDAVLASCAFPVLLPPTKADADNSGRKVGEFLVDGSVVASAPVGQALELGAKSIIMLDTGASTVPQDQVANLGWYAVMAVAFSHLVRGQAAHDLAHVAAKIPVFVVSSDKGSPLDLRTSPSLFAPGHDLACEALEGAPKRISRPGIYGQPEPGLVKDDRVAALIR